MEENSREKFIIDTSALISLESIKLLDRVIEHFDLITTASVIRELNDFAKHGDEKGEFAKSILKKNLISKKAYLKENVDFIEQTDTELYNLAKQENLPLITDDHRFVHHTRRRIQVYFSTFFLSVFVSAELIKKEEALMLLEKMRNIRNWKDNIIYLVSKKELEDHP